MSMSLPVSEGVAPSVCRMLRTKTHYGTYTSTETPWQTGDSSTAVYWCLKTMENAGPDEGFAHPHECRAGRKCFAEPLE